MGGLKTKSQLYDEAARINDLKKYHGQNVSSKRFGRVDAFLGRKVAEAEPDKGTKAHRIWQDAKDRELKHQQRYKMVGNSARRFRLFIYLRTRYLTRWKKSSEKIIPRCCSNKLS